MDVPTLRFWGSALLVIEEKGFESILLHLGCMSENNTTRPVQSSSFESSSLSGTRPYRGHTRREDTQPCILLYEAEEVDSQHLT